MRVIIFLSFFSSFFIACNPKGELTTSIAQDLIKTHIETNLPYEATNFTLGERKFRTQKDAHEIENIKTLQNGDYINIDNIRTKKRWLSSDSTLLINIRLNEKSLPYVVELKETKAKLKTIEYQLVNNKDITIKQKSEKRASAKVVLRKVKTPFYLLSKDSHSQDFIIREFKFKFSEKNGWELVK